MLQQQGLKYLQTNLCVLQTGMKHGGGKECFVIKNCAHVFLILRTQIVDHHARGNVHKKEF